MTEKQRQMIKTYIPSPRDSTLQDFEYYTLDVNDRVVKGRLIGIGVGKQGEATYLLRNGRGHVYSWASDELGFVRMSQLYDNKQDCKNNTHFAYDDWEELRALEQENKKLED